MVSRNVSILLFHTLMIKIYVFINSHLLTSRDLHVKARRLSHVFHKQVYREKTVFIHGRSLSMIERKEGWEGWK
jgi:hypothetical protein